MRRGALAIVLASSLVASCQSGAHGRPRPGDTAIVDDDEAAIDDDVPAATADPAAATPVSAAEWAAVEAAAAPVRSSGPPDELARALALIERGTIPKVKPADVEESARQRRELAPDALAAVAALVRWADADGRLPPLDCVALDAQGAAARATWHLAQAALLVAGDDPDARELGALVYLAGRLRAEGPTLLEGIFGGKIADSVRAWAVARGRSIVPAARRYQPTEEGLLRVAAAEAVCAMALMKDPGVDPATGEPPSKLGLAVVLGSDGPPMRRYWVELLADLRARPRDPAAIDRRIAERDAEVQREEASVLALGVRDKAKLVAKLREYDERYRAWLAAAPAREP